MLGRGRWKKAWPHNIEQFLREINFRQIQSLEYAPEETVFTGSELQNLPKIWILRENTLGTVHCDYDVWLWTFCYQKIPWKWLEQYLTQKFREIVVTEVKYCDEHVFWFLREFESYKKTTRQMTIWRKKLEDQNKCNQILEKVHILSMDF